MAKRKKVDDDTEGQETQAGEQLDLLDVSHPLAKKLKPLARKFKQCIREEFGAREKKIEIRKKMVEAIHAANMPADDDGTITVSFDDVTIKLTPRDEKVKVILAEDESSE